jgi:hypothetical protein
MPLLMDFHVNLSAWFQLLDLNLVHNVLAVQSDYSWPYSVVMSSMYITGVHVLLCHFKGGSAGAV